MKTIQSSLAGVQGAFGYIRDSLQQDGFTLANWEYDGGYFDKELDDKGMVFLRLPIEVMHGKLDDTDARIEFGTPFVLKHVYRTGVENHIGYTAGPVASAMMNQFQEPVNKDAEVEDHWVQQAADIVRMIEQRFS